MADEMGRLSAAMERRNRRSGPEIFVEPRIVSVGDIKRVINEIGTKHADSQSTTITTVLKSSERGKSKDQAEQYKVSATLSDRTKRDILLEGMSILKKQIEAATRQLESGSFVPVNGREMKPATLPGGTHYCWADPLIKRWLGAYRDGLLICWRAEGFIYRYDIFTHELSRIKPT